MRYLTGCLDCDETVQSDYPIDNIAYFDELLDNFGREDDNMQFPVHLHRLTNEEI